jgi:peptidoglycan/LPS O-acetylase OafA/YrhL
MNRIAYVDGLRAIAVLSVVVYHAAELSARNSSTFGDLLLRQGCHGVELFFVISGFCLSYPFLAKLHQTGAVTFDAAAFAVRRIVRIVPPYYVALCGCFILAFVLQEAHVPFPMSITAGSVSFKELLRQALFLDSNTHFANTSFWSLAVELRWYVLFPVALWLWVRSPRAFGVVAVAALMTFLTRAGSIDLLVLPAFMLGIVAAHVHISGHRLARFALPAVIPLGVLLFMQTPQKEWGFVSPVSEAVAFAFVIAAGEVPILTRLLSMKALTFVGAASYSIYLIHAPLMGVAEGFGMWAVCAPIFGVAAGIAFWYVAERPFVEAPIREQLIAKFGFVKAWLSALQLDGAARLERPVYEAAKAS